MAAIKDVPGAKWRSPPPPGRGQVGRAAAGDGKAAGERQARRGTKVSGADNPATDEDAMNAILPIRRIFRKNRAALAGPVRAGAHAGGAARMPLPD